MVIRPNNSSLFPFMVYIISKKEAGCNALGEFSRKKGCRAALSKAVRLLRPFSF
jgi:hypothetical protein